MLGACAFRQALPEGFFRFVVTLSLGRECRKQAVTDADVVEGLKRRDPSSAEELVDRYQVPLVRYFLVSLPDPSFAEDAAQEVFCRLIASVHNGRVERVRSLGALVFTIARRLAIDMNRSWKRRPRELSLETPLSLSPHGEGTDTLESRLQSSDPDPREQAAGAEAMERVTRLLREMDPETREVIVLRHIQGLTSREVAQMLGIAEGTVWSRLSRGLEVLRRRLAELDPEERR